MLYRSFFFLSLPIFAAVPKGSQDIFEKNQLSSLINQLSSGKPDSHKIFDLFVSHLRKGGSFSQESPISVMLRKLKSIDESKGKLMSHDIVSFGQWNRR